MIPAEELVKLTPLPDSRLAVIATVKGAVWRCGRWWEPIYCANCGTDGGLVTGDITFSFWLCQKCEQFGHIDGTWAVPDRIFWAKVELEQRERYGRLLTEPEVQTVVEADASPLATLIQQGR